MLNYSLWSVWGDDCRTISAWHSFAGNLHFLMILTYQFHPNSSHTTETQFSTNSSISNLSTAALDMQTDSNLSITPIHDKLCHSYHLASNDSQKKPFVAYYFQISVYSIYSADQHLQLDWYPIFTVYWDGSYILKSFKKDFKQVFQLNWA